MMKFVVSLLVIAVFASITVRSFAVSVAKPFQIRYAQIEVVLEESK
jgi:hypothetical protein